MITPNRGLLAPSVRVTLDELALLAKTDIDPCAEEFRKPLQQDAKSLAQALGPGGEPVLLGSVATPKYASSALSPFVIGPPQSPSGRRPTHRQPRGEPVLVSSRAEITLRRSLLRDIAGLAS